MLTVYGGGINQLQNDHYSGADGTITDSFAIEFVGTSWWGYMLLGIGFLILVLGLVALYCYRKRVNHYPRMPSME